MKIQNYFKLFYLFALAIVFNACSKNETEVLDPNTFGYDYYPVEIGKQWIYQTDSIVYSKKVSIEIDTTVSYMMEEVKDTFRNSENKLVYRLDVFYTRDTTQAWELISSSFIQKDSLQLHKIENGLDYIRLVFPVRKFISWEGNIRIDSKTEFVINGESLKPFVDDWSYSYDYVDQPEIVGTVFYSKVTKVEEMDEENLLEKRYSESKYAKGVGMVYKEQWILDTQITDNSIPFEKRAEKGMILRQTLISHK
jgi:hypothetical protein